KAARTAYLRAYERANDLNRHGDMVTALNGAALSAISAGDLRDADESVFIATQLAPAMDDLNQTASAQLMAARLILAQGDAAAAWLELDLALTYLSDDAAQQQSYVWDDGYRAEEHLRCLVVTSDAARALSDPDAARRFIRQALEKS